MILAIIALVVLLFLAITLLIAKSIYIWVLIYPCLILIPGILSYLSFIKLTDNQLIYFGLFKKKKIVNLNEVSKIEFGYFKKDVDIRFLGKEKRTLIRCTLNLNLLEELIKLYDKKIFKLSISHHIFSKKTMNVFAKIFDEDILEKKDIHARFNKK